MTLLLHDLATQDDRRPSPFCWRVKYADRPRIFRSPEERALCRFIECWVFGPVAMELFSIYVGWFERARDLFGGLGHTARLNALAG